ncbi:hypothetical protein KNE206_17710 [Kitasatospora sp. NE20-6]|uniref:LuxR C-terminal-related transcriptional regulator n=1 Tax=Kitasatospora sp. NE20-6 TaxID=2859066 RepID=UPI0034DB8F7A
MTEHPAGGTFPPLPDEGARQLYQRLLDEGGRVPADSVPADDRAALDRLLLVGLVTRTEGSYCVVSPRAVSGRLGDELRTAATRLLVRAESLPEMLDGLTKAYDGALPRPEPSSGGGFQVVGREQIRQQIVRLANDCRDEILTAQPGPRPAETLAQALRVERPVLERGCRMRTLYQPSALTEPAAVAYATAVTALGARARVLDAPFQRMLAFDRSTAVISAADDHGAAVVVTDIAVVAYLVAVFERDWAGADVVQWADLGRPHRSPSAAGERVGRLLAQGLTQRAVATRLGLSERTVAGHISQLRDRYGARTLFQLGWLMRGSRRD